MAFVVSRPNGRWELRRSSSTGRGPRSETLVSFKELTADVVARAVERSEGGLTADQVRAAALRAGAPVAPEPCRRAAAQLIRELSRGATLPESWKQPLRELLAGSDGADTDAESIAEWADASAERRGEALRDLLLLVDAVPTEGRRGRLAFPGFPKHAG